GENEETNEEIDQTDEALVVFNRSGLFGRSGDERSLKLFVVTGEAITDLGPEASAPKTLGDLHLTGDERAVDGEKMVAFPNARARGRRIRGHLLCLDALVGVQPDDTVVGRLKFGSLNEVQPSENHGGKRGKRQDNGPKADSKGLLHELHR